MNEQWFLLGDIHGSAQPIYYFYQKNKDRLSLDSSENYMILLGDVGANFAICAIITIFTQMRINISRTETSIYDRKSEWNT
jgi:hypothetical protein